MPLDGFERGTNDFPIVTHSGQTIRAMTIRLEVFFASG